MRRVASVEGQALSFLLGAVFLATFGAAIFLFLMYQEGLFRFEFGPEDTVKEELVFDKNRVLELFKREELLIAQEKELSVRAERIEGLRTQIQLEKSKLTDDKGKLDTIMAEITSKFKQMETEEEKNLQRLVNVYSKMKAQRVATIFDAMDEESVAQLLERMQDKTAAKILGEIGNRNPERAAQISDIIKGKFKKDTFNQIAK